jgi:hypothetical protein
MRPRIDPKKDLLMLRTKIRFVGEGDCVLREVEKERSCDCGDCGRVSRFQKNFLLSRFELIDFEEEDRIHDKIVNESFSINSESESDPVTQSKDTVLRRIMTINKARLGMKKLATKTKDIFSVEFKNASNKNEFNKGLTTMYCGTNGRIKGRAIGSMVGRSCKIIRMETRKEIGTIQPRHPKPAVIPEVIKPIMLTLGAAIKKPDALKRQMT